MIFFINLQRNGNLYSKPPFFLLLQLFPPIAPIVVESTSPGSPRVVGGTGVAIGELPFICSIRQRQPAGSWSSPSWTHLCGSTIVNENWLLTSAHCVAPPLPKESLLIVCGVRQARNVAGIEPSPEYVDGQRGSDLALVR